MNRVIMTMTATLALMCAISAAHAGDQDFDLVNQTGLTIDQFYCSPSTTESWEEDILGVDVLSNGGEVEIAFSRDAEECVWDLLIVDEQGDKIYWKEINLCETSKITLYYENGKPTAEIEKAADEDEGDDESMDDADDDEDEDQDEAEDEDDEDEDNDEDDD